MGDRVHQGGAPRARALWSMHDVTSDSSSALHEQPRERLRRVGVRNLSLTELLVLLIGSGGAGGSASVVAIRLSDFFGGSLALERERAYPMVEGCLRDIADGSLRAVVDRSFPLAEAAAAHAYIESRQAFGRVLLIP